MPPLTTLGYDNIELGRKIFESLKECLEGKEISRNKEKCYIVERASVKKIARNEIDITL